MPIGAGKGEGRPEGRPWEDEVLEVSETEIPLRAAEEDQMERERGEEERETHAGGHRQAQFGTFLEPEHVRPISSQPTGSACGRVPG